ncbi:NAD-dependent epimerase/dehydratase family protein [Rhizohabitans arisaemae]|uniref:NAD-dependent epimerase/dehydratase family protein n=1 Tax=Rhizohabitans arisaemae TaxID=2720610 RepID=UPI0024B15F50|nr:NAD(P)-dependent oxidoreductase [Rhizohabitans arisaemae]
MAAIVTGSAGFIGRSLVRALLDRGEHVVGIDRLHQTIEPGFTPITADLLDGDPRVYSALRDAGAVYHLAGCPGVRDQGVGIGRRRTRDNVLATRLVLAAVPIGVPLVVTSSSSVYGGARDGRPSLETDRMDPIGGYARSKAEVERLCAVRGGVTVVRPFTVAGEGQRPDMALSRWIAAARAGRPLRILGSPERTRDITDVRDTVRALIALAWRNVGGVVNIGTGVGHTLRAMVKAVGDALNIRPDWYVEPAAAEEVSDSLADIRRLRELAGFTPVTDLTAVVARQAACLVDAR